MHAAIQNLSVINTLRTADVVLKPPTCHLVLTSQREICWNYVMLCSHVALRFEPYHGIHRMFALNQQVAHPMLTIYNSWPERPYTDFLLIFTINN